MTWIPRPIFIIEYLIPKPTRVILEVIFMIYYIIPILRVDGTLEFMDEKKGPNTNVL